MCSSDLFDGMRGVRWWPAPLFGYFWSAWLFVILRYPSAYFASGIDWTSHMAVHFGVLGGVGILLLLPYCLFRPLVQPLSGYNGY